MIFFLLDDQTNIEEIRSLLEAQELSASLFAEAFGASSAVEVLTEADLARAEVLVMTPALLSALDPSDAARLMALARRARIVLVHVGPLAVVAPTGLSVGVDFVDARSNAELVAALRARGLWQSVGAGVPSFDAREASRLLERWGALSVLTVYAEDFQRTGLEFGEEAYTTLRQLFQELLVAAGGATGGYRKPDLLYRRADHSNFYYIFLAAARGGALVPPPGALERLSERLATRLQRGLWRELAKRGAKRRLPSYLTRMPRFSVGYATTIHNPCVAREESVGQLLNESLESARLQASRMDLRRREFLLAALKSETLLQPAYQAVFRCADATPEAVQAAEDEGSLLPVKGAIYGWEALVRVRPSAADRVIARVAPAFIDVAKLDPGLLFDLAQSVHLSLELDQECLRRAVAGCGGLPGKIFVNILPRNFYFLDRLEGLDVADRELVFEVSESEAINNFDLLSRTRERLPERNFGIAIDDFGKGYAGFERILKISADVIKLDRCLVAGIDREKPKRAFLEGLLQAARESECLVLAEGVETLAEYRCVRDMGVDLAQGFLLHRPMPVTDALSLIRAAAKKDRSA